MDNFSCDWFSLLYIMDEETAGHFLPASYIAGFELDEYVYSKQFRPKRQYSFGIVVLSAVIPWTFAVLSFCNYVPALLQSDLCKPLHLKPEEVQIHTWTVEQTAHFLADKFSTSIPLGIQEDAAHAHPIWSTWKQCLWRELQADMHNWQIFYPGIHIERWQDGTLYLIGCYVCNSIRKKRREHMARLLAQTDYFSSLGVVAVSTVDLNMEETLAYWRRFHGSSIADAMVPDAAINYDLIEEACCMMDFGDASNADDDTIFPLDDVF